MVLRGSYYDENGSLLREIEGADTADYPHRFTTKRTKGTKNAPVHILTSLPLRDVQCLSSAVPGGAGTFRFVRFVLQSLHSVAACAERPAIRPMPNDPIP
jgi:hypothetical protein